MIVPVQSGPIPTSPDVARIDLCRLSERKRALKVSISVQRPDDWTCSAAPASCSRCHGRNSGSGRNSIVSNLNWLEPCRADG